jgi:type I restriction enzyme, R subunit
LPEHRVFRCQSGAERDQPCAVALRAVVRGAGQSGARSRDKQPKAGGFSAGDQTSYQPGDEAPPSEPQIRASAAKTLQDIVGGLSTDNFIVRQHRRAVEKYREPKEWESISDDKREELVEEIAPLPSSHMLGTEEAKASIF